VRYLGIIPARGGSKGIPRKNLYPLLGKPLLAYTAEAALGSEKLWRVVLSTDDDEIANVGASLGLEVPFLRPPELAQDSTPILPVLADIVVRIGHGSPAPDAIVLLQPTSPLRTSSHIDDALELFEASQADSLVSVTDVPHQFHPTSLMEQRDGWLVPAMADAPHRRQEKSTMLARNGPAILVSRVETILDGTLYGRRILAFWMDENSSVDVDSYADLMRVEFLLTRSSKTRAGPLRHPGTL
jgi:CMP-N,N'-diacetyllegionaminic acid synthase